uniref:Uncharacterized protein n=1 Tax=Rhizophora mucronata TaxID=61149 RepID=A0A2P2LZP1_RHIMU
MSFLVFFLGFDKPFCLAFLFSFFFSKLRMPLNENVDFS